MGNDASGVSSAPTNGQSSDRDARVARNDGSLATRGTVGYETGQAPATRLPFSQAGWLAPAADAPRISPIGVPPGSGEPSFKAGMLPRNPEGVPVAMPAKTKPAKVGAPASADRGPGGLGIAYPGARLTGIPKQFVGGWSDNDPGCAFQKPGDPTVLYVKGTDGNCYEYHAKEGDLCIQGDDLKCLQRDSKGVLRWADIHRQIIFSGSRHVVRPTNVNSEEFLALRDGVRPRWGSPVDQKGRHVDAVHFDKAKLTWVDKSGQEVTWIEEPIKR